MVVTDAQLLRAAEYLPFVFAAALAVKGSFYHKVVGWLLSNRGFDSGDVKNAYFCDTVLSMVISPYSAILYCAATLASSGQHVYLPWCVGLFVVTSIAAWIMYARLTPTKLVIRTRERWIAMGIQLIGILLSALVFHAASGDHARGPVQT